MLIYYEDISVGDTRSGGSYRVERDEILDFGRKFDPQPFHIDEDAAQESPFGGLVASGWHTASICMRLMVEANLGPGGSSLGSPGVDELRWLAPVRPGDTLSVRTEVVAKRTLKSRADRGLVTIRATLQNQDGVDVLTLLGLGFFPRKS